jgi:hypothetical protein
MLDLIKNEFHLTNLLGKYELTKYLFEKCKSPLKKISSVFLTKNTFLQKHTTMRRK